MTPQDPLKELLSSLGSEGRSEGEGAFTLDAQRAAEMLQEQGRLGRNAPLYLLSALFDHTNGAPIELTRSVRSWRLSWQPQYERLPPSLQQTIAIASFAARGLTLSFEPTAVKLRPASRLEAIFEEVAERIAYYPWFTSRSPGMALTPNYPWRADSVPVIQEVLGRGSSDGAELLLTEPRRGYPPRWLHGVRGIIFPRRWSLPVDLFCWDPLGRPDLGLESVTDSGRRQALEEAATELFLDLLEESLKATQTYCLNPVSLSTDSPLFARYLDYAVRQTRRTQLAEEIARSVMFVDVNGHRWSVSELSESYGRDNRLMTVMGQPLPESTVGPRLPRPVLLWGGEAESLGGALFTTVVSGEGYLYSLSVNEQERQKVGLTEPALASVAVGQGRLSLLAWGEPDRPAELQFVGPRRARETFYLDSAAPKGLRLFWECPDGLETVSRELELDQTLRQAVLELFDLRADEIAEEALRIALSWGQAQGPLDRSRLQKLESLPLFESVNGSKLSLAFLRNSEKKDGALSVLMDRSSSLPVKLPVEPLLWWDPCFTALGLATEDAGVLVREAYWQEKGRQSWLEAHPPRAPLETDEERHDGPHLVGCHCDPATPTEVRFWREGRPFGRRTLSPELCPPGYRVTWVEDDIPGDVYWSGPTVEAVKERLPSIEALCRRAASQEREAARPEEL